MIGRLVIIGLVAETMLLLAVSAAGGVSQSITSLSLSELNQYRDCVRIGLASGRYMSIASEHGVPMGLCPHGNMQFLPWHRHHLAAWESTLNCTIPYWDWALDAFPSAFLEDTYQDAEGHTWPNPLLVGLQPHSAHKTRTVSAREFPTSELEAGQRLALSRSDLEAFSSSVEDAHNLVHVSIGGDMSDVDYASYDPIFYSHHKNVDRLWFIWQTSPQRASNWASSLVNDYVQTASGRLSSLQIANDLSAWISPSPNTDLNANGNTSSDSSGAGTGAASNSNTAAGSAASNSGSSAMPGASTPGSTSAGANLASGAVIPGSGSSPLVPGASTPGSMLSAGAMSASGPAGAALMAGASMPGSMMPSGAMMGASGSGSADASLLVPGASTPGSPSSSAAGSSSLLSSSSNSMGRDHRLDRSAMLDEQRRPGTIHIGREPGSVSGHGSDASSSGASKMENRGSSSQSLTGAESMFRELRQPHPVSGHVLLKISNVKSTVLGYRMDVILFHDRIGQIGMLGMGQQTSAAMPEMAYSKDRLVDVTCHLDGITNLTDAHNQIRFELYNDQNDLVARPRLNFTLFAENY